MNAQKSILGWAVFLLVATAGCSKKEPATAVVTPAVRDVQLVQGIASIEPLQRIVQLTPETGGTVAELPVQIAAHVAKGQPLVMLDRAVEQAQLDQARTKLVTQQALIQSQELSVAALGVTVNEAKTRLERNEKLFAGGAATQQVRDDSRFAYDNAALQQQAAAATLNQQRARLAELQADVRYYQALLERKILRAPVDGTVLSLDTRIGNGVDSKTAVGEFAPDGPWMAIAEIDELFADKVAIGQPAIVRAQGDSLQLAAGKVVAASPALRKKSLFSDNAGNLEDRRVREVRIQLDEHSKLLIGSRVEVVIKLK